MTVIGKDGLNNYQNKIVDLFQKYYETTMGEITFKSELKRIAKELSELTKVPENVCTEALETHDLSYTDSARYFIEHFNLKKI